MLQTGERGTEHDLLYRNTDWKLNCHEKDLDMIPHLAHEIVASPEVVARRPRSAYRSSTREPVATLPEQQLISVSTSIDNFSRRYGKADQR